MSKAERLKVVFAVCVALDASLVAWLAQNYATSTSFIVAAASVAAVLLAVLVVFINRSAYHKLKELEDA